MKRFLIIPIFLTCLISFGQNNTIDLSKASYNITPTNNYYVDGVSGSDAVGNGSAQYPFKTIQKAMQIINANAAAKALAGNYPASKYVLKVAPGTYSDSIVINNEKYLRIEMPGVNISGHIDINTTQQTGDYYSKIDFIGGAGNRPEKGDQGEISGVIYGTRNNDALIHICFSGIEISNNMLFTNSGTWSLSFINSAFYNSAKFISGIFTTGTNPTILIETQGLCKFKGHIANVDGSKTNATLYDVNTTEFDLININPRYNGIIRNCTFMSNVTIDSMTFKIDNFSYKEIIAQTENLTGATITYMDNYNGGDVTVVETLTTDSLSVTRHGNIVKLTVSGDTITNTTDTVIISDLMMFRDSTGNYITPYDTSQTHTWIDANFIEFGDSTGIYITPYDTTLTHSWISTTFIDFSDSTGVFITPHDTTLTNSYTTAQFALKFDKSDTTKLAYLAKDNSFTGNSTFSDMADFTDTAKINVVIPSSGSLTTFSQNVDVDTLTADHVNAGSYDMGIMQLPTDAGYFGKLVGLTVSAASPDNTIHAYYFAIDGDSIVKIKAQANGSGGIDNKELYVRGEIKGQAENTNGTTFAMELYNSTPTKIFGITDRGGMTSISNSTLQFITMKNSSSGTGSTDGLTISTSASDASINNYENGNIFIGINQKTKQLILAPKTVTDNALTSIFSMAFPSDSTTYGNSVACDVHFTVSTLAADGRQTVSGVIQYSGVEYLGTVTVSAPVSISSEAKSSGTYTITPALVYAAGVWTFKITVDSDLTTPVHKLNLQIHNGNQTAITPL